MRSAMGLLTLGDEPPARCVTITSRHCFDAPRTAFARRHVSSGDLQLLTPLTLHRDQSGKVKSIVPTNLDALIDVTVYRKLPFSSTR